MARLIRRIRTQICASVFVFLSPARCWVIREGHFRCVVKSEVLPRPDKIYFCCVLLVTRTDGRNGIGPRSTCNFGADVKLSLFIS
jgi:hypothetical protein